MAADRKDALKRRECDILPAAFIKYQLKQYLILAKKLNAITVETSNTNIEKANRIMQMYTYPPIPRKKTSPKDRWR